MNQLERVIPATGITELSRFIAGPLSTLANIRFTPFDPAVTTFWGALARKLLTSADARRHPELVSLGFFLRETELVRLERAFSQQCPQDCVSTPLGLAFHLPPANVDTIFIYSLALSSLVGNANIVRLSRRHSPIVDILLQKLTSLLQEPEHQAVSRSLEIVRYGHESNITAAISQAASLRVIWGGDTAIDTLRKTGLAPTARELSFPDRFSMATLSVNSYQQANEDTKQQAVDAFVNDSFWFDQMACSSPRLVIWVGDQFEANQASNDFFRRVAKRSLEKGFRWEAGTRLEKFTLANRAALDMNVETYQCYGENVDLIRLKNLDGFTREHNGGGFFYECTLKDLSEISSFSIARDQTLSYFGFSEESMRQLAQTLLGKGPCRMVSFGQALSFNKVWDGMDLLVQMSRLTQILT